MVFLENIYRWLGGIVRRFFYFGRSGCEYRPWGYYRVIEEKYDYKLKEICVSSGHRLSYQRHLVRSEYWCIISGYARVILDGKEVLLEGGGTILIPKACWHRIENLGDSELIFVELQRGSYLGEDDIERQSDDYGRV